jgi:phosphatidylinositol glycan class N
MPQPATLSPDLKTKGPKESVTSFKNIPQSTVSYYDLFKILSVGILFHLAAIASIFDIYFKSPLSHGQRPVETMTNAPAKRLFFIIGDGLRADKCFAMDGPDRARVPFLHRMASEVGSFGVSHTRVPTESRPGHVAMLAGFYEDPSAVTKGWRENPVEYDHVVRGAQYAFVFGAPEIVGLFPGERVRGRAYPESLVDFGLGRAVVEQDKWPFDRLYELFEAAKTDLELNDRLRSDRVFFMLHLLGHDTNGHAYGPHSPEYADNTRYVDSKVQELVERVRHFYNDDKTAYVFTADHGMSDGRSHGDGDPDNTRTPLIVWGAGVSGPEPDIEYNSNDQYSSGWGALGRLRRRDINQADLAPLMSTLLGTPIPIQSQGALPVEYVRNRRYGLQGLMRNARQMLENYRVKEEGERMKHGWWAPFVPYRTSVERARQLLHRLEQAPNYEECRELMGEIGKGIDYLNTYDQALTPTFALFQFGDLVESLLESLENLFFF